MACLNTVTIKSLRRLRRTFAGVCVAAAIISLGSVAHAQTENPVFIDESSHAWETFQRAEDRIQDNPGEAVRLLQELLDESPHRLIPVTAGAHDQFTSIRTRALEVLRSHDELLSRYRSMETAEATRQLNAGRLEMLVRSRPLTQPGLEAMLRLSQRHIENAAFRGALTLLEEALAHPDLTAEDEAHAWFMYGLASHYIHHEEDRNRALDRLQALHQNARPLRERLEAMIEQGGRPREMRSVSTVDQSAPLGEALSELVAEPIWSVSLDESLFSRRSEDMPRDRPIVTRALEEAGRTGMLMTVAPTIAGDVVYVNEGHRISAYDRFSGSPVWNTPYVDRTSLTIMDRDELRVMDLSIIAVGDGRLVTLTGHAYPSSRSSDGEVLCLDAETGRKQWSRRLDRLAIAQELEGVFPHSAPIIAEGKVFVLGRRVTPQALASCYLFAFDLDTGEPMWVRHIVSSGSLRRISRAFDTLMAREGSLYVASPLGAVARVDARSGFTQWLHRFPVPLHPSQEEQQRRPWEMTSPAVTDDHVIAILPGAHRIAVIDRHTGNLVAEYDATDSTTWNRPAYLLTDGELVFAIGEEIRAFHSDDFTAPIWRSDDVFSQSIRGRVQLTGDDRVREHAAAQDQHRPGALAQRGRRMPTTGPGLIVPVISKEQDDNQFRRNPPDIRFDDRQRRRAVDTVEEPPQDSHTRQDRLQKDVDAGVLIVDGTTGDVRHQLELNAPGNPVATEAQLAVAGNDHLSMYMSLSQAERMLRSRMAERPDDPEPALSLVRLAIRAGDLPLVLEASRSARNAIREHPTSAGRERLFSLLVAVEPHSFMPGDGPARHVDREPSEKVASRISDLYGIVREIAEGPEERLAYLLAYGDWRWEWEQDRADRGRDTGRSDEEDPVLIWQKILDEPELASFVWEEGDISRLARRWALARQVAALSGQRHDAGSSPLAAYEEMARDALDTIERAAGEKRAERLIALGRRYPLAEAGVQATLRGARALAERGDMFAARAALLEQLAVYVTGHTSQGSGHPSTDLRSLFPVLLGTYVGLCLDADLETEAAEVLATALAEYGDRQVTLDKSPQLNDRLNGGARRSARPEGRDRDDGAHTQPISAWLRLLGWGGADGDVHPDRAGSGLPRVGTAQRRAEVMDGSLLEPVGGATQPRAYALTMHDAVVRRHAADETQSLKKQWESEIAPAGRLRIVHADEQRVVLWNDVREANSSGQASHAVILDAATGEVQWRTPRMSEIVGLPAHWRADRSQSGVLPSGEVFEAADVLPRTDGERLVLITRDGRTAGFDMSSTSAQADWSLHCGLVEVHHAAVGDGVLVAVGVAEEHEKPSMVVVDLARGTMVGGKTTVLPISGTAVQWMHMMPFGRLVYASEDGMAAVDALNQSLVWANTSSPAGTADSWWPSPGKRGMLVMRDEDGWMRSVDVVNGTISDRFDGPSHTGARAMPIEQVLYDGEDVSVLYRQRMMRYDRRGRVLGADIVLDDRRYRHMLRASDRVVVLSEVPRGPEDDRGPAERPMQHLVRIYSMAPDGMLLEEPSDLPPLPEPVRRARVIDGWLLVSTSYGTLAVHMPTSED